MNWLQHWTDVLFVHFRVRQPALRRLVPPRLTLDTFAGEAWVSYVFFRLRLRPPWLPYLPGFSSLVELNVRTYVRSANLPGIYFLRMYADNRLAIWASRMLTPLCYERAALIHEPFGGGALRRQCRCSTTAGASIAVAFETPQKFAPAAGSSVESWLVERYRLYVDTPAGLLAAEVDHPPWSIANVAVTVEDRLRGAIGLPSDEQPLAHYSRGVAARFNAFRTASCTGDANYRSTPRFALRAPASSTARVPG